MKGQVSTEYLVILAIVLVVALVVVYLIGGFASMGAGTLETQSGNYWAATYPLSITTHKAAGIVLDLQVQNNDLERLTITNISVDGASVFSTSTSFNSGESKVIVGTLAAACGAAGTQFTLNNVVITYTKAGVTGLRQSGAKPIVGRCS